jgi:hypothetical protein
MTRRDEFLSTHPDFHPGMLAYSEDGEELGEVQKLDEDDLTIEKGAFFSADRRLPYDAVAGIRADHLIIHRSRADLEESKTPDYPGLREPDRTEVPVYEKEVRERQHHAERLPAERTTGERAGPMPGGETFQDEEVRNPSVDEQIEAMRRRPPRK